MRVIVFLVSFLLCACSQYSASIKRDYDAGKYTKLYETLYKGSQKPSNELLLVQMQSGFVAFSFFGPHFALSDLDKAEKIFSKNESEGLLSGLTANIGATLSNDMTIPYRGYIFEGVLINLYKAMSYASIGDDVNARVEFNRANDRQRRARDYYQKEISKANAKMINSANAKQPSRDYTSNVKSSDIESVLNAKYSNLKNFSVYKDLINPYVPYISGLFFMIDRDYTKSIDLLKEAYGISKAKIIAEDMDILEKRRFMDDYSTFTWVVIEDGSIARKQGFSFSQPVVIGGGISSISIALPALGNGRQRYNSYSVNEINADPVVNLSQVFASEFEKQLPSIITRAIVSAIVKFTISQVASTAPDDKTVGAILGLVGAVAFSATTAPDERSSVILPNSAWVARAPNAQQNIAVYGDGHLLVNFTLNDNCDSINNRKKSFEAFNNIAKSDNLSGRISLFKAYNYDSVLCNKTDNIVYLRVRGREVTHFIVKGG